MKTKEEGRVDGVEREEIPKLSENGRGVEREIKREISRSTYKWGKKGKQDWGGSKGRGVERETQRKMFREYK